ncbi:preprotein translocase subunit SecG [Candidatus Mesenet endosymbiont of Agriotes lineatus]|uniref:preprotein translocase subunit SecG n=1 Tax=Candidatus Mesenet endosymbiont of Agriotes lineatus TaxID=3077948 RepID=UPI0030CC9F86
MVLEILQIVLVIILVILVLLQSPGTSSLSGFGGSQQNSIFSINSSASIVSKLTAIVAAAFMINTLLLAGLRVRDAKKQSITEEIKQEKSVIPFESE